jgi:hypothetical protein
MNTFTEKTSKGKNQIASNSDAKVQSNDRGAISFEDNSPATIVQRKMQELADASSQTNELAQFEAMVNHHSPHHPSLIQTQAGFIPIGLSPNQSNNINSSLPIQRVKIEVDGLEFETNNQTYEDLISLRSRVSDQDRNKLELAILAAHAMNLRNPVPTAQPEANEQSGLRRRGAPAPAPSPAPDTPVPAPAYNFATSHGPASHGPMAWTSTGAAIATGAPDVAAARNSTADTFAMIRRTGRDLRQGDLTNAAISATQGVLSAGQMVLSTPAAHVLNHGAGAMVGSPVPLPVADAIWYPANAAKDALEQQRDPKDKTE